MGDLMHRVPRPRDRLIALTFMFTLACCVPGCADAPTLIAPSADLDASAAPATKIALGSSATSATALIQPAPLTRATRTLGTDLPTDRAFVHISALADDIGPRPAGSEAEGEAARYIAEQMRALGYDARIDPVPMPTGPISRNVVSTKSGRTDWVFVLGAHFDTTENTPGANDNASGTGALLAIAEVLADEDLDATIEFVFFGAEEAGSGTPDDLISAHAIVSPR